MADTATLVRRFIDEAWNAGNLAVIPEIMSEPYDAILLNQGFPPLGKQSLVQIDAHVRDYRVGFPDLEVAIEQLVAGAGICFVQSRLRGTHEGPFLGIPPSGKAVDIVLSAVYSSSEGKLTGHRVLVDFMGLFQQLGLMPDPVSMMGGPPPGMPPPPGVMQ